jgi:hypothetical protein
VPVSRFQLLILLFAEFAATLLLSQFGQLIRDMLKDACQQLADEHLFSEHEHSATYRVDSVIGGTLVTRYIAVRRRQRVVAIPSAPPASGVGSSGAGAGAGAGSGSGSGSAAASAAGAFSGRAGSGSGSS